VTIVVGDGHGDVIADAEVVLEVSTRERELFRAEGRTSADGAWVVEHVPPGPARVKVRHPAGTALGHNVTAFEIAEGQSLALEIRVSAG
jgi:hypothetical protein